MSPKDTTKYAAALSQVVVAVSSAVAEGRITELTALRLIAAVAGRLGVEVNAEDELKDAREEAVKRRADDGFRDTGDPAAVDAASDPNEAGSPIPTATEEEAP